LRGILEITSVTEKNASFTVFWIFFMKARMRWGR
jgi:hypothetical protein